MPKCHVLHGRDHRHAHEAGQTGEVLGQHRVLLVRHRRRALLAHREEFRAFEHFGALHVADFDRDILDRRGDDAQRCKEHRMAVTRDHLGRDRLGAQAQFFADMLFDARVDIGEGSDRARDCAGRNLFARRLQAGLVAVHFGIEAREGEAHRRRLGMDAVRAAHADSVFVLIGAGFQRRQNLVEIGQQDVCRAHELHVQAGVEHVRRGHALMDEAGLFRTDMLGQMRQEGDHVMLGHGLDLVDARHVEFHILGLPHSLGIFARDHAQIGLRIAGMGLDLIPDLEFRRGFPDIDHLLAGITRDHWQRPFGCGGIAGLLDCVGPRGKVKAGLNGSASV